MQAWIFDLGPFTDELLPPMEIWTWWESNQDHRHVKTRKGLYEFVLEASKGMLAPAMEEADRPVQIKAMILGKDAYLGCYQTLLCYNDHKEAFERLPFTLKFKRAVFTTDSDNTGHLEGEDGRRKGNLKLIRHHIRLA
jgi:hypothetical protein